MGNVVCTIHYRDDQSRDLILPDHIPTFQLVNSIAKALRIHVSDKIFFEIAIRENNAIRRIPGSRTLQQAFVVNGMNLQLMEEKRTTGKSGVLVADSGMAFLLRDTTLVGRLTKNSHVDIDLTVMDTQKSVSRQHAVVTKSSQNYLLQDSGSRNGTFVNEVLIAPGKTHSLIAGDEVCFGSLEKGVRLRFEIT